MLRHGKIITLDIAKLAESTPLDATGFPFVLRMKKRQKKVAVEKRVYVVTARHITGTLPVCMVSVNVIPNFIHCHRIDTRCGLM
jgi:hypothetical protein